MTNTSYGLAEKSFPERLPKLSLAAAAVNRPQPDRLSLKIKRL